MMINNIYKKKMSLKKKIKRETALLIKQMEVNKKFIAIISNNDIMYVIHYLNNLFYVLKERKKNKLIIDSYKNYKDMAAEIYRNLYDCSNLNFDNLKFYCTDIKKAKKINYMINNIDLKNKQDDINLLEKLLLHLI